MQSHHQINQTDLKNHQAVHLIDQAIEILFSPPEPESLPLFVPDMADPGSRWVASPWADNGDNGLGNNSRKAA
jgi:hypothetical protein